MQKVLAAIVASTFALGTVSVFAADAAKRDDLTQTERSDMRNRADQLTRARANGTEHVNTQTSTPAKAKPVANKKHVTKTRKTTRHTVKKSTTHTAKP